MATPTQTKPFQIPSNHVNRISKLFPNKKKTRALLLAVECPGLMVKERAALVQVHRTTLWRWSKDPVYMREYVFLTEICVVGAADRMFTHDILKMIKLCLTL